MAVTEPFVWLQDSSSLKLDLTPEYDFDWNSEAIRSMHRTQSGKLWIYQWGFAEKFKMSLRFVPWNDAGQLNYWWYVQQPLTITFAVESWINYEVKLVNKTRPMSKFEKPYASGEQAYMKGVLELSGF